MRSNGSFLRRNPVVSYFLLTFFISWTGAFAVVARPLANGKSIPKVAGLIIFPVMLLGPLVCGIMLNWVQGTLRDLWMRLRIWRAPVRWYALLLLPPILVLIVLCGFKLTVSPAFSSNNFYFGVLFGIPAGILEEIGWTGYVYPQMIKKRNPFSAAVLLGLLWSLWHLPAINFLGASTPHAAYWFRFFLAFTLAMTAMRVIICWIYSNTNSVLLAQLMHVSSTGALVVFSPPVTPAQEALWYAVYGCVLWLIVLAVVRINGREMPATLAQAG